MHRYPQNPQSVAQRALLHRRLHGRRSRPADRTDPVAWRRVRAATAIAREAADLEAPVGAHDNTSMAPTSRSPGPARRSDATATSCVATSLSFTGSATSATRPPRSTALARSTTPTSCAPRTLAWVPCPPHRKRRGLARPTMKTDPHPIAFDGPFNVGRREIAAHAAQPLVAARIAKITAPQGILL